MENIIEYNGKELKWNYDICPCLICPLYEASKQFHAANDPDARHDKCYTSRCTYNAKNASDIAWGIYYIMHPNEF